MNLIALSIKECLGDSDSLLCNSKKIITCFFVVFFSNGIRSDLHLNYRLFSNKVSLIFATLLTSIKLYGTVQDNYHSEESGTVQESS